MWEGKADQPASCARGTTGPTKSSNAKTIAAISCFDSMTATTLIRFFTSQSSRNTVKRVYRERVDRFYENRNYESKFPPFSMCHRSTTHPPHLLYQMKAKQYLGHTCERSESTLRCLTAHRMGTTTTTTTNRGRLLCMVLFLFYF